MAADKGPTTTNNDDLITDYQASLGAMERLHTSFDEKEKILLSQSLGKIDREETTTRVSDPTLLASVIKQNNTTMAQMPSGKVVALTKENRGKSLFMDLILQNHVIPHATSQYDVYTKLWMLSLYRKVYGSMGAFVDFIKGGGYGENEAGPDFTILPIRSIIPQIGKYTETDCDYIYVRSRVNKKWLESRKGDEKWKNLDKLLDRKADFTTDMQSSSFVERNNETGQINRDDYEIITKYEKDKWTTFHVATREILRQIDNPHKNNKIPIIMCHAYPMIDRFIGLGDFERGIDLHTAAGSLISLYLEGVKAGIFPNFKIDPQAIENWAEIKKHGIGPGQIWLMKSNMMDRLEQMNINPNLNTFQSTYQFLKGAIMTVTNTSDTTISGDQDLGFGKTPQALKMQAFTQGMQTQFDRRMLELATEKIFDRMIDLIAKKQEKPMNFYLEEQDLRAVEEVAPDVVEMFEVGGMGKVKLKPSHINNVDYRYEIDQGSTVKKDEVMENQTLTEILGLLMKIPGTMESLAQGGTVPLGDKQLNVGELVKRWVISSGVTDWDKIITDNEEVPEEEQALNMEDPNIAQAVNGAFNPQIQPEEQPMPSQTPAEPVLNGQASEFEDPQVAAAFEEIRRIAQGG